MAMSFSSRQKYVEDALSCTNTPFSLSYSDPTQKWIIRNHLTSLFLDFPSLKPSVAGFTHNDGATVNLLTAAGDIRAPPPLPPVSITIWVNENYPSVAPLVYVHSTTYSDHPFIDSSGATTSSYLSNWDPANSNLSELVRNLVKILSIHIPSRTSPNPFVSRMEAMDRLALSLHEDSKRLTARFGDEIEELSSVQSELVNRSDVLTSVVIGLENERDGLKKKAKEMGDEADVLLNWLKVYGDYDVDVDIDDVFEGVDGKSVAVMEYLAADMAMEDLLYNLEKAVEKGGIYGSFDSYLKQVRNLARTQFVFRAKWMKALQGSIN